ncbi:hypothetical protein PENTCL1PPCAC_2009 [Pristionchus entomophagus]|uniref:Serpentine receptor class gamma n=1 Tax=Pristionchus entomophagus TaxID=358040 RepID=A0AAV5SAT3_9BILA|nr:hypothetical protein PENTCL1PPCAC_2009 [Pristionchus entomophagus]
MHNYKDDCRGPPSGSISCSCFISVFTYYTGVILTATAVYLSTLLPITQMFFIGEDGKAYPEKLLKEYGGVYRETIRFEVSNSFAFTYCTPIGNSSFLNASSDLPSFIRYIEFYAWIGVYVKVPVISGLLYRGFMILAEEREAIYFGKTNNSVIGCMRVITHLLECLSIYFFIGMHQDYDQPLLWLHRSALSLVIITSSFHIALTAFSHYRRRSIAKLIITSICLFFVLVSFPAVLESNYNFFLEHSCSLYVTPRLAIAEYLLFSSFIIFHFSLLPLSLPTLEVSLSFYDDHPNYVPDRFKPLYQPVVPHQTF